MPNLAPTPAQGTTPPPAQVAQQSAAAAKLLAQLTGPNMPFEALQARVAELSQQLVGLRAQRQVLGRQTSTMPSNGLRAELEGQKAQLDNQIVQVEMQLESAKAQIASRLGVPSYQISPSGTVQPQPGRSQRSVDPDMVVGMSFALAICIGLPLAIAYARRIWKGTPKPAAAKPDESSSRLERLEHAVDAIAIEIERVAEGQRFVTKILAERPATVAVPQRAPAVELQDAALGEAKPFLALGAGPMEQIRVGERQSVMQSITPH